jgi:phosphopantothenoylcysteine decarboxylase / phosphopantothenate---cysteine ligase
MSGPLAGKRVIVSAGPTYEDPVRFIGNRSSGRMGFAMATAAVEAGADVVLVAGPVQLPTPTGVRRIDVRSAAQMHDAVLEALPADVYIATAAVADYTPRQMAPGKIKKTGETLVLELVRTRDVLADVAAHPQRPGCVVGFAAETEEVERYARGKLAAKKLDLIAANRVGIAGSGFESDDNALTVYWHDGKRSLGPAPKTELARQLIQLIIENMAA